MSGDATAATGQIPKPGFEANGTADQMNAAMRKKSIFPAAVEIIDGRALAQDPAEHTNWRTDHGALTDDGTHPNDSNGIPWVAGRLTVPAP